MKNFTTKLTIAAAALIATAGAASAQSLEAKIPFAFRASGKVLPAGTYQVRVTQQGGSPLLVISGKEKGQSALAVGFASGSAKEAWTSAGKPVLSFQCGVSRCALRDIWMGGNVSVYRIPTPSLGRDEPVHTAEVAMQPVTKVE